MQVNYVSAHDNETLFDIISLKVTFCLAICHFVLFLDDQEILEDQWHTV